MKKSLFYEQSWDGSTNNFYFSEKQNNKTPPHFHKDIEIIYNLEGSKKISINGIPYTLNENTLAISLMYNIHQYYDGQQDSKQITFTIPYKYSIDFYTLLNNKKPASNMIQDYNKKILFFIEKLKEELQKKTHNQLIIRGLFNCIQGIIFDSLILGQGTDDLSESSNLFNDILNYIDNNYKNDITLESISSYFGYNKFYFSKKFNSFFQTNINEYLGIVRLSYALDYISEKNSSVYEAATECGFKSVKTFYKYYNKLKYNNTSSIKKTT